MTPVGPSRLTLPPDHQQPAFPSHGGSHSDDILQEQSFRSHAQDALPPDTNRPGSRRFAQCVAFMQCRERRHQMTLVNLTCFSPSDSTHICRLQPLKRTQLKRGRSRMPKRPLQDKLQRARSRIRRPLPCCDHPRSPGHRMPSAIKFRCRRRLHLNCVQIPCNNAAPSGHP